MKISEVEIRRFRSIKEARFLLHDITGIVGENNAGKTGVLRALSLIMKMKKLIFWIRHISLPQEVIHIYI